MHSTVTCTPHTHTHQKRLLFWISSIHTGRHARSDANKWSQVPFVRVMLRPLLLSMQCVQDCCYNRFCASLFASLLASRPVSSVDGALDKFRCKHRPCSISASWAARTVGEHSYLSATENKTPTPAPTALSAKDPIPPHPAVMRWLVSLNVRPSALSQGMFCKVPIRSWQVTSEMKSFDFCWYIVAHPVSSITEGFAPRCAFLCWPIATRKDREVSQQCESSTPPPTTHNASVFQSQGDHMIVTSTCFNFWNTAANCSYPCFDEEKALSFFVLQVQGVFSVHNWFLDRFLSFLCRGKMLRRKPTRIELKLDDLEEYETIKKEREAERKAQSAATQTPGNSDQAQSGSDSLSIMRKAGWLSPLVNLDQSLELG